MRLKPGFSLECEGKIKPPAYFCSFFFLITGLLLISLSYMVPWYLRMISLFRAPVMHIYNFVFFIAYDLSLARPTKTLRPLDPSGEPLYSRHPVDNFHYLLWGQRELIAHGLQLTTLIWEDFMEAFHLNHGVLGHFPPLALWPYSIIVGPVDMSC